MRASSLIGLPIALSCCTKALQVPFRGPGRQESDVAEIDISWDFEEGVHPNSTAHLVFDTVNSLLQQWPNTRYRNGR
jgi:hypothetical protein